MKRLLPLCVLLTVLIAVAAVYVPSGVAYADSFEHNVDVTPKISDGVGTVTFDKALMPPSFTSDDVLNMAVNTDGINELRVQFSIDSINYLKEKEVRALAIKSSLAFFGIEKQLITYFGDNATETVEIRLKALSKEELASPLRKKFGDRAIVSLQLIIDGVLRDTLPENKTMLLGLPFEVTRAEDVDELTVYSINGAEYLEITDAEYSATYRAFVARTRLSRTFGLYERTVEEEKQPMPTWAWVIIGTSGGIILAIGGFLVYWCFIEGYTIGQFFELIKARRTRTKQQKEMDKPKK